MDNQLGAFDGGTDVLVVEHIALDHRQVRVSRVRLVLQGIAAEVVVDDDFVVPQQKFGQRRADESAPAGDEHSFSFNQR